MDTFLLPATTYVPDPSGTLYTMRSPLARRHPRNTLMNSRSQHGSGDESLARMVKRTLAASPVSPLSEDNFPTPRPPQQWYAVSPASSDDSHSPAPWKRSRSDPQFDDLYDVTDDEEAEVVPLICSDSVKKSTIKDAKPNKKPRYPSLIIPSPSTWPTIEKLKMSAMSAVSPMLPTPPSKIGPSSAVLSMIVARSLQVPERSSTPSLDGSLTSEELDKLSCPSTPDSMARKDNAEWGGALHLNPEALATLNHIAGEEQPPEINPVIELAPQEMQEVARGLLHRSVDIVVTPVDDEEKDLLSALSVPSPGGFFSSLGSNARHTWSVPEPEPVPSTSVAENFYGVPWLQSDVPNLPDLPVERVVEVSDSSSGGSSGQPTPRLRSNSADVAEVEEIEYNENYDQTLQVSAIANLDRTSLWLNAQETYMSAIQDPHAVSTPSRPSIHDRKFSADGSISSIGSPSKKSVRWADEPVKSPIMIDEVLSPKGKESTYLEGFQHLRENRHETDVFVHRKARAEAMQVQRRCFGPEHRDQLTGRFELTVPVRPSPRRPISHFYTEDSSVQKEMIARAQKERQALEQIQPSMWTLDALKTLNGGRLVSRPSAKWLSRPTASPIRILDIGGAPTCDWAWQVAMDFPNANVYNVITAGQQPSTAASGTKDVSGPDNYTSITVPNLWTLPFPSGHFDVVSARSLYALLKANRPPPAQAPPSKSSLSRSNARKSFSGGGRIDEYDLCVREAHRLLKPGGYFEYALLDAEIVHDAGLTHEPRRHGNGADDACADGEAPPPRPTPSQAQALAVEFAFNLRTRGYDPHPTTRFVPRLQRAGFDDVRRAYMVLPMPSTPGIARREGGPFVAPPTQPQLQRRPALLPSLPSSSSSMLSASTAMSSGASAFSSASSATLVADSIKSGVSGGGVTEGCGCNGGDAGYFGAADAAGIPEKTIGPDGAVEPVVLGSTADASCVAGLVGARAWEQWMLKLQTEMGREEKKLIEEVGAALEEGAAGLAGWRYLTGWARKARE